MRVMDLPYLIATAREAGRAILEVYETDFQVERKSDSSPITEADLRAHRVITDRLRERYPDIPILSEESTEQVPYDVRRQWTRFWLRVRPAGRHQGVREAGWAFHREYCPG